MAEPQCQDPLCDDGLARCRAVPTRELDPCTDSDSCTESEQCKAGVCTGTAARACDDGLSCTTDSCDPASGCVHEVEAGSCLIGSTCAEDGAPHPTDECLWCDTSEDTGAWVPAPTCRCPDHCFASLGLTGDTRLVQGAWDVDWQIMVRRTNTISDLLLNAAEIRFEDEALAEAVTARWIGLELPLTVSSDSPLTLVSEGRLSERAPAGTFPVFLLLSGSSVGEAAPFSVELRAGEVSIEALVPVIDSVSPTELVDNSASSRVRVYGRDFSDEARLILVQGTHRIETPAVGNPERADVYADVSTYSLEPGAVTVCVRNVGGGESCLGEQIPVRDGPPNPPACEAHVAGPSSVRLHLTPSPDDDLVSLDVLRRQPRDGPDAPLTPVASQPPGTEQIEDGALLSGTTYEWRLEVADAAGQRASATCWAALPLPRRYAYTGRVEWSDTAEVFAAAADTEFSNPGDVTTVLHREGLLYLYRPSVPSGLVWVIDHAGEVKRVYSPHLPERRVGGTASPAWSDARSFKLVAGNDGALYASIEWAPGERADSHIVRLAEDGTPVASLVVADDGDELVGVNADGSYVLRSGPEHHWYDADGVRTSTVRAGPEECDQDNPDLCGLGELGYERSYCSAGELVQDGQVYSLAVEETLFREPTCTTDYWTTSGSCVIGRDSHKTGSACPRSTCRLTAVSPNALLCAKCDYYTLDLECVDEPGTELPPECEEMIACVPLDNAGLLG